MKHFLYIDYGFSSSYEEKLKLIKQVGFDGVFLFYDENTDNLVKLVKENNLEIETLHLPFTNCNEFWVEGSLGEEYVNETISGIRCAGRNNIKTVVFHITSKTPPLYNQLGIDRINRILEVCKEEKVNLALENLRRLDYLDYIYENIDHEYLKFCFDSGHANAFTKNINEFPFEKYKDKMICCHLHDNNGIGDEHLIPFTGNIDFIRLAKKFKEIGYFGPLTSEAIVKSEKEDELNSLMKIKEALDFMSNCFSE